MATLVVPVPLTPAVDPLAPPAAALAEEPSCLLLLFQSGIHLALKRRHDLSDLFGRIGIIVGCILHDFTFVGSCCAVAAVLELLLIVVAAGF